MPEVSTDPLRRLLAKVRWHMAASRAGRVSVGATFVLAGLIACAAALGAWFDRPVVGVALLLATVAAAFTIVTSALGVPDELAAAHHVDRVMGLHELFASALSTRAADDAASRSLGAMADDVASRMRADQVPTRAPPLRVTLAAALCLSASIVFALLVGGAGIASNAMAHRIDPVASARSDRRHDANSDEPHAPFSREPNGDDQNTAGRRATNRVADSADSSALARGDAGATRPRDVDDQGSANGQTTDRSSADVAFDAPRGMTAGGSDAALGSSSGSEATSSTTGTRSSDAANARVDRRALATSSSSIEGIDRRNAALPAGDAVPARCRDLVRAYFDVDAARQTSDGR